MTLNGVKANCDAAAQAIAALPVEQWAGWVVYILEELDARLYGQYQDHEQRRGRS